MILYTDPQGSPEWLEARRGVITASRFRDCRGKLRGGAPNAACVAYALDVARERAGGTVPSKFQTPAMRTGTVEEPVARLRYEMETGRLVTEAGFICTDDRKFGVSVDGLIGDDGIWECKTMVSSDTLFNAMVYGDLTAYTDQCEGAMWILGRKWVDLSLWCPDFELLKTIRITRNDDSIQKLEDDLLTFEKNVSMHEAELRKIKEAA